MPAQSVRAVVLAAGKSTRFKRKKSKLLSKICGREMVLFPLKILEKFKIPVALVLGYQADEIKEIVEKSCAVPVDYFLQHERLGTGDAVLCSQEKWDQDNILILNGDVPLLTPEIIEDLLTRHEQEQATISFIATRMINPTGYGRVVEENEKIKIIEEKDCPEKFREINKVNAGIYVIKRSFLEESINKLQKSSVSGEFYLTDLVALASDQGLKVQVVLAAFDAVRGVNTLQELWAVEQVMRSNLIKHWMNNGVRFELAQSIHIDIEVEIGPDSFIGTGAHILNGTKIGEGCFVAAFTILENTTVGDETTIHSHSVIQDSRIGNEVHIGPFARLRNNVVIADNATVGNFVEIKNSSIGSKSKVKHLAYLGDTTVGKNVNIGAGTIVCNYDGFTKKPTILEDDVFIGSNNTLVAPLIIGKGAYSAAGSTITRDIPSGDLAIARARQENKAGYAKKLKNKKIISKAESVSQLECKKKDNLKFHFLGAVKTSSVKTGSVKTGSVETNGKSEDRL
ncbi:bifunctional UDP-N-acetylglucosamine diphosphorylase/glucosamine-1-phosphate N-acetyltransferase GlmU [Candidatus Babeliales bacterium]|nr:bifunctional UDP-N-acetylglucosamine diphosphorylase/glucosamine-1-phosphate N-acetyltransferase GlmU [Candidatus Babeliales bacterium]